MRLRLSRAAFLVAFAFLASNAFAADGPVNLHLNLKADDAYVMRFVSEQKIIQAISGANEITRQTIEFDYRIQVVAVHDDRSMDLTFSYDRVRVEIDAPQGAVHYDSAAETEEVPPLAVGFAALVDAGFTVTLTPQAKVTHVDGVDALIDRILTRLRLPEGPQRDRAEAQFRSQFGEDSIRSMMEQSMNFYPGKPVKVGDAWKAEVDLSEGFPMKAKNTWTLIDRTGGVAVVELKSQVEPSDSDAPISVGPMTMTYELTGTQEGRIEIVEKTGWPRTSSIVQKLSGVMKMTENRPPDAGGDPSVEPRSVSVPITLSGTYRIEVVRK